MLNWTLTKASQVKGKAFSAGICSSFNEVKLSGPDKTADIAYRSVFLLLSRLNPLQFGKSNKLGKKAELNLKCIP